MTCLSCKWLFKLGTPCSCFWYYCLRPNLHHSTAHFIIDRVHFIKTLAQDVAMNCVQFLDNGEPFDIMEFSEYANDPFLWIKEFMQKCQSKNT